MTNSLLAHVATAALQTRPAINSNFNSIFISIFKYMKIRQYNQIQVYVNLPQNKSKIESGK